MRNACKYFNSHNYISNYLVGSEMCIRDRLLVIKKLENVYRNFWMLVSIFVTLEHKLDEIL